MSTEAPTRTGLASWIAALVDALDADPSGAGARLRHVVEGRRARIALDDDVVVVSMENGEIAITPDDPNEIVDGLGFTTTDVVLGILAGEVEVATAVERGLLDVAGSPDAVTRMLHAIELLLDGSARVPALRRLADRFVAEAGTSPIPLPAETDITATELSMLQQLGLLNGR